MSTNARRQGGVESVQSYAAERASLEERQRSSKQIMELLRMSRVEDAQTRLADLTRCGLRSRAVLSPPLV